MMKCLMLCLVGACMKFGVVMSGNSARSVEYRSIEEVMAPRCRAGRLLELSGMEWYVAASTSRFPLRLTSREWARRKSAPSKGRVTSAMRKSHLYVLEGKWRGSVHVSYMLMVLPLAAARGGPFCFVRVSNPVAGRMLPCP
jgi:hypothetical protein